LKTSPESAISCNVAGSTLDGVSVEGADSAPNRAIVRTSDESQTLRHTVERAAFDDCAMSDGRTRDTDQLLALIAAVDALLDASRISQARRILHELRSVLAAGDRRRGGVFDLSVPRTSRDA
jgi:hypothetical protein